MAKKTNQEFKLGLTRAQLIEAAQFYDKPLKSAKKASTKTLEQFIIRNIAGKGVKVPSFNERELKDLKRSSTRYGTMDTLKLLTYRMDKIAGERDERNFLRLTVARNLALFYDGKIESHHIDEFIRKLPLLYGTQVDSDFIDARGSYHALFSEYAEELRERDLEENN